MGTEAVRSNKKDYAFSLREVDPWIMVAVVVLTAIGLVMVFSASSSLADKRYADSAYFLKRQAMHLGVGVLVMLALARLDYGRLHKMTYPILVGTVVALLLVFIPVVGHKAGGAYRWVNLLFIRLQPGELAKLALVFYLAYSLSSHQDQVKSFSRGFFPNIAVACVLTFLVVLEPDLGTAVTLMALASIVLFVAGTRFTYLGAMGLLALPVLGLLLFKVNWRLERMLTFLNPWADPKGTGWQIIHSFLALGSGGFTGAGLSASKQKLFYLPEPHTDFIFSVLGEELGFWGVSLVLGLFMVVIWRGIKTALEARDLFGTYLALGCTLVIGLQAFVNVAVVMGLLPTKGLTLPFISYGGSSLLVNLACVGLLLSVASHKGKRA
nr:putative lipid II flippase FtsW [Dethiosulfatarculus sandiegensis]